MEFIRHSSKILLKQGDGPGKLRGHSTEIVEDFLFLFGGLDEKKQYKNELYKLDLDNLNWSIVQTKGKSPEGRVNTEMRLFENNKIIIIGGIQGSYTNIDKVFSDVFIFNISRNDFKQVFLLGKR